MADPALQKECGVLVGKLALLAEDAATTGEGARAFLGLVEAAKALPEDRTRRLREFFSAFAHELRGVQ
jgi:hypothetical protein